MAGTSHEATALCGSRESTMAMAQVSVTPAKTRPLPTKSGTIANHGVIRSANKPPMALTPPATMRTWRSSDIRFGPMRAGLFAASQAFHAAVENVKTGQAGAAQRLFRFPGAIAGLADQNEVVLRVRRDLGGVLAERIERYVVRAGDVSTLEFTRRANVDETDAGP